MKLSQKLRYRIVACVSLLLLFHLLYTDSQKAQQKASVVDRTRCILHNGTNAANNVKYFDLLSAVPRFDRGIFFIDATCSRTGIVGIKPRFACSIESAARLHPDRDVFVLFSSAVGLPSLQTDWSLTIQVLMRYSNVHFRNVQFEKLAASTPLQGWIESSTIFRSRFLYAHVSDIIRILLLYKFGGTYLDLDQMVLQSFNRTERNFVVLEEADRMANSILDFQHNGTAHKILQRILTQIKQSYDPNEYAANGGPIIERFMRELCAEKDWTKANRTQCNGIDVFGAKRFFPLFANESSELFTEKYTKNVMTKLEDAITFHFYNSHTSGSMIKMGRGDAYDLTAKKHCPRIYETHQDKPF